MGAVHISPFRGSWYPGHPAELTGLLNELFARSRERTGVYLLPRALGFVVPHAGLMYSGTVAGAAYRSFRDEPPARIVVMGFSHRGGPRSIAIPDIDAIETPLGRVTLDREFMERVGARAPFRLVSEDRVCDHSVEIQLPLLQHAAPGVPVTPLYVGALDEQQRRAAADALAELAAEGAVFLASSDFTHYGAGFRYEPFPPDESVAWRLRALDMDAADAAGSLDPRMFHAFLERTGATVCGTAPIGLWLETLRRIAEDQMAGGEIFQTLLDYQTSGEVTEDYRHSVSYAALGYYPAASYQLSAADRNRLLASAYATLRRLRETGERTAVPPDPVSPPLTRNTAVFVSLHQGERLLGCVGTYRESQPLSEAVPQMTLSAALDDPRFAGVLDVEGEIQVEISVLSPLKAIRDASAFQLNQHGAWLRHGSHSALLLPQVAAHYRWDRTRFLEALARKAGLGPKTFRDPETQLAVFRAQVFS